MVLCGIRMYAWDEGITGGLQMSRREARGGGRVGGRKAHRGGQRKSELLGGAGGLGGSSGLCTAACGTHGARAHYLACEGSHAPVTLHLRENMYNRGLTSVSSRTDANTCASPALHLFAKMYKTEQTTSAMSYSFRRRTIIIRRDCEHIVYGLDSE